MLYTGLDLLKSFSYITTVNDEGQAVAQLKHLMKVPPEELDVKVVREGRFLPQHMCH